MKKPKLRRLWTIVIVIPCGLVLWLGLSRGFTLENQLHYAISHHELGLARRLLAASGKGYRCPDVWLQEAVYGSDLKMVHFLLEHGGDPAMVCTYGTRLIHEAHDSAIIADLVAHEADVNARMPPFDITPLHCATGGVPAFKVHAKLLEQGVDIGTGPDAGTLAKVSAIRQTEVCRQWGSTLTEPDVSVLRALISCGADVNARDSLGCTPLDYACSVGSSAVQRILREHGARLGCELRSRRMR